MKQLEYIEGQRATENFERGMKALFKVSKSAVVKRDKKAKHARVTSVRKSKRGRQGLEGNVLRFSRPCRFVARRLIFTSKLGIRKATASYLTHGQREAVRIIHRTIFGLAVVVPEYLLIHARRWSEKTEISAGRFIAGLGVTASKF